MRPAEKLESGAEDKPSRAPAFARARTLHKHLAAVNARNLPFEERLRFLDDAQPRVEAMLADLAAAYEQCPQPMSEHAREALALAQSLAFAYARGFRTAAGEAAGTTRKIAPLLFNGMRCVAGAMRASYRSYSRLPEGAWKQMHEMYLQAERDGVAAGVADAATRMSIHDLYCEALLVSLTDPYRLVPGEVERIEAMIRELRTPVTLGREAPETEATRHFLVECADDRAPHPLRDAAGRERHPDSRILDAGPLVDALRAMSPPSAGWPDTDERRVLAAKLLSLWDDPPRRTLDREPAEGTVAICVGVKPIASFVAHESEVDGEAETSALRQGLTMPLKALPEDESGELIPIHEWAVINVSAGGVRVRRNASTAYPITIGEVVGIRAPGKVQWRIGVTRWLTGLPEGTTEFGVQFFAYAVCAVWIKRAGSGGARTLGLLVANGDGRTDELLLAPAGTYTEGAEYELRGEDFRSRVRATTLVEGKPRFELFRVTAG